MNVVLLSGGSGKRLWPLSNDIRSKQFIKIFKNESGNYESMVERMYSQIKKVDQEATITIATGKSQVSAIHNQLGEEVKVCVEPCRRDTFAAIVLACAFLRDVQGVDESEPVVICPVDPYVEEDYFKALSTLNELAKKGGSNLYLLGMEPTYPSEKYGYIIPENTNQVSKVKYFKEKPTEIVAMEYLSQGALWNGGIFAFQLGYVLEKAREKIDFTTYQDLFERYDTIEKISFDYAIVEEEQKIDVVRFSGEWKDLGTWNTLTEAMSENVIGKAMHNEQCENLHILNELNIPILCMGVKNVVVAASPEGILVSEKDASAHIKPYVDSINQQIMFAEKSWGSYQVMDVEENSVTIKIILNQGSQMNYHSHKNRIEMWNIIDGEGWVIINGEKREVFPGEVIEIPQHSKHTIIAKTQLKVIEVQIGREITVHDKEKYDMPY